MFTTRSHGTKRPVPLAEGSPIEALEARALLSATPVLNLLFFGNSFTNNTPDGPAYDMPATLKAIAVADGLAAPNVYEQILLGETLSDHLNAIAAAGSGNIIVNSLPTGQSWNDVIIQEYSTRPTNAAAIEGDVGGFESDSLQLFNDVRAKSPSVQGVLYETWARGSANSDYPTYFASPAAMQNQLLDNYAQAATLINSADGAGSAVVSPVGEAWRALNWQANLYSTISGDGVQYHPSTEGILLNAMVNFDTIYHANVAQIPLANVGQIVSNLGLSNSIWSALSSVAASLVAPGAGGGALAGSQTTPAGSYNLSTLGVSDWAHWGRGNVASNFDDKSTGNFQIGNVAALGSGQYGAWYDPTRSVMWTDGNPTASATDDAYIWANTALGAGYTFSVPASTTSQLLYVYAGGYSSGVQLSAQLSDGSATSYVAAASGTGSFTNLYAITFSAASAGQTLTVSYFKSANINGTGGSADLIAAWLAGAPVSTAPSITSNPTSTTVTAGQSATLTAAASGSPTPTVQWYSEAPGASSFTAISGATATTLIVPSTIIAQSGTQYEALFANGVGSPATTTVATLTVNPTPVGGSLSGTSSASAAPYNLTALGTSDWVHFGVGGNYAITDRKATGNSQISNFTPVGTGGFGGYTNSARTVSWSDGSPTSSSTDSGYVWANNAIGSGFSFTAPADTTTRTLYVYVGGYSSGSTLTATLSDGSAAPYTVSLSGNAAYQNVVAITYSAASANQKLTISYTKTANINGTSGSADLIAAWLAGAPVSTAPSITSNPTNQTVTAGQSATFTAAASGSPTPTVQWYSEAPGASSFTAISGATSTSLIVPSTTTAQSGTKYEAVFSNGVGSPATTTAATLTVNPAPVGGSLSGTSSASAAPYNLTALGTADWVHFGVGGNYAVTDRKATGNTQISNFTAVGTGGFGGYTNSARTVTWGDGTPTASSTDSGYVWANNALGSGFSFTAPADTTTRTLYVYVGGYSSGATLTATLSDGSAAPYTVSLSGNAAYQNVVAITYSAASANQKLTISYTKTTNLNGTSGSADLIAAWLH